MENLRRILRRTKGVGHKERDNDPRGKSTPQTWGIFVRDFGYRRLAYVSRLLCEYGQFVVFVLVLGSRFLAALPWYCWVYAESGEWNVRKSKVKVLKKDAQNRYFANYTCCFQLFSRANLRFYFDFSKFFLHFFSLRTLFSRKTHLAFPLKLNSPRKIASVFYFFTAQIFPSCTSYSRFLRKLLHPTSHTPHFSLFLSKEKPQGYSHSVEFFHDPS